MNKYSIISYVLFLIGLTFFSYTFVDANLSYLRFAYSGFFVNREFVSFTYLGIVILFYIFYLKFISFFREKESDLRSFASIIFITSFILTFSYPAFLSYDIFNYIMTAKVLFNYHENPYIVMPIEFTNDPYLLFTRATNKIALYGPIWLIVSLIPFMLGFGNFLIILINFKLLVLIFYLSAIFLLYKMTKSIYKASLFALNPLVIVEVFVGNHNDIVMMSFVLLSYFFLFKKRYMYFAIFIVLSILIKYATIILLPVTLYVLYKHIFKENINQKSVYLFSFWMMIIIFFLSVFREEIYPWYAIWFLIFTPLIDNKKLIILSVALSFGMLLSYIPYMLTGSYFGYTPLFKYLLMVLPVIVTVIFKYKYLIK